MDTRFPLTRDAFVGGLHYFLCSDRARARNFQNAG